MNRTHIMSAPLTALASVIVGFTMGTALTLAIVNPSVDTRQAVCMRDAVATYPAWAGPGNVTDNLTSCTILTQVERDQVRAEVTALVVSSNQRNLTPHPTPATAPKAGKP